MELRNVTKQEIETALLNTNKKFEDNIIFNRFESKGKNFNVTLKVKNSKCPGARIGFSGRAMTAACWHVYGTFIEEILNLNNNAVIVSMGEKITINGGNWVDKNIGSIMNPMLYSDACRCNER